jgi:ssDNA-binding replication factor A large subunit
MLFMMTIPLSFTVKKIKEQTKLSEQEITDKIQNKLRQLSGLISEEGAAHIIANELGVKLMDSSGALQIENILAGMRNVELSGKVVRKYELREFSTEKRSGKMGSFLVADSTGIIRVVLWNDQADHLDALKEGTIIQLKGAYARENNGRKELH